MVSWLKKFGWRIPVAAVYGAVFFEIFLRLVGSRWFFDKNTELLNQPYQFAVEPVEKADLADPSYYRIVEGGRPAKVVSISGDGLREPERNGEPVGFLALGSSSTFAGAQDDRMAWPALTAQTLNERVGSPAVWIGNAAHDGMNTVHNVLHLRYLAERYKGKLQGVILNVGLNDANYFWNHDVLPSLKPETELRSYIEAFPLPSVERMMQMESSNPWWHQTYLYQFGLAFNLQIVEQKVGTKIQQVRGQDLQSKRREKSQTADVAALAARCQQDYTVVFRQLLAEARRCGVEVVVMPMPPIDEKSDQILVAINSAIRQVCAEEKVLLFDVEDRLKDFSYRIPDGLSDQKRQEYLAKKRYLYHDGHHFNNEASKWVADELSDFMIRNCSSIGRAAPLALANGGAPSRDTSN